MKYRLTLITAVLIVCALCSTHSFAEEVVEKGFHYEINQQDHVATLVRYDGSSSNVAIPNTIKYNGVEYHVTAIHGHAFNKIGFVSPERRYEAPTVVRPPQM